MRICRAINIGTERLYFFTIPLICVVKRYNQGGQEVAVLQDLKAKTFHILYSYTREQCKLSLTRFDRTFIEYRV